MGINKLHRHLLNKFKLGKLTAEEFIAFEEQFFLLKKNWNKYLTLYPGMRVAYSGGKEYVAESDIELWEKIEVDDPKKERKMCSAVIPGVRPGMYPYETW